MKDTKQNQRTKRRKRIKAKMKGTANIPRVSVFRSNKHLFVQIIDDSTGKTILSNSIEPKAKSRTRGGKTEVAGSIGEILARKAREAGITKIVFDRGGYKYHGRVKALAEGLRKGGLMF
jgi:large subunit ribosomal protein L18